MWIKNQDGNLCFLVPDKDGVYAKGRFEKEKKTTPFKVVIIRMPSGVNLNARLCDLTYDSEAKYLAGR